MGVRFEMHLSRYLLLGRCSDPGVHFGFGMSQKYTTDEILLGSAAIDRLLVGSSGSEERSVVSKVGGKEGRGKKRFLQGFGF
ncbi:hypothetical protein R1flu_002605 [Riccia fluitans]|uniref:Uncharacterized protein n=1 Tax=Riccia fluitans TaxID=41844 RepID=A0ABD1Y741_9MARC